MFVCMNWSACKSRCVFKSYWSEYLLNVCMCAKWRAVSCSLCGSELLCVFTDVFTNPSLKISIKFGFWCVSNNKKYCLMFFFSSCLCAGVCRRFLPSPFWVADICSSVQSAHRCRHGQLRSVSVQRALFHVWPWDIHMPGKWVCALPAAGDGAICWDFEENIVVKQCVGECAHALGRISDSVISPAIINNHLAEPHVLSFLFF